MNRTVRLGVLVSGGGTNLQAIIDACDDGVLKGIAEVAVVVSNRGDAYALQRAERHGIEGVFVDRKMFPDAKSFCARMVEELRARKVELVCLAGFMTKLEPNFIEAFRDRIVNIHPALLPKFGGKGMYGHHVHRAVIAAGESESGATVHLVDEIYDNGPHILAGRVPVLPGDTPELLARRVLETEHRIFPQAIRIMAEKILKQDR